MVLRMLEDLSLPLLAMERSYFLSLHQYIGCQCDIIFRFSRLSSTTKVHPSCLHSNAALNANTRPTGWNAPKRSALLVHSNGLSSTATNEELCIEFDPSPDYGGIAKAAAGGKIWGGKATSVNELDGLLKEAVETVKGGTSAVLEVVVLGTGS